MRTLNYIVSTFHLYDYLTYFYSLQKFKLSLASTVVSQDNSSLAAMDTSSLLDLFNFDGSEGPSEKHQKPLRSGNDLKSVLNELSDLWDEDDYKAEYDMQLYTEKETSDN